MKKMNKDKVLNVLVTVFSILIILAFFPVIGGCLTYGMAEHFYTWAGIVYIVSIIGNIVCGVIKNREEEKKKELK